MDVMKHILATALLLSTVQVAAQTTFVFNGDSGEACSNHRCLAPTISPGSSCVGGKCVCNSPTVGGLGLLDCSLVHDGTFCAIFNDPMVRGFDGSHSKVALFTNFLMAHVLTKTCQGTTPTNGMCDIRLTAWGCRRRGKTFLKGFQVNVFVATPTGGMFHYAARVHGEGVNGTYTYIVEVNTNPFGMGEYGDNTVVTVPGYGAIYALLDGANNIAGVGIEPCGVEIGFRGVEMEGDPLLMPSGVYINVVDACEPTYVSTEQSICPPPEGQGMTITDLTAQISQELGYTVSEELVTLFKALTADIPQNFENAPPALQLLTEASQECPIGFLFPALEKCGFIYLFPTFLNCFDDTSNLNDATQLLHDCIFALCDGSQALCLEVQIRILDSGCQSKIPPPQVNSTVLGFSC